MQTLLLPTIIDKNGTATQMAQIRRNVAGFSLAIFWYDAQCFRNTGTMFCSICRGLQNVLKSRVSILGSMKTTPLSVEARIPTDSSRVLVLATSTLSVADFCVCTCPKIKLFNS